MSREWEVRADLTIVEKTGGSVPTSPASAGRFVPWNWKRLLQLVAIASLFCLWLSPRAAASKFVRGDTDGNGGLDITDAVRIFGHLFLGTESLDCADAADADDSGALDITDGIYVLLFLFLGGDAPPGPYPGCGGDDAKDDLDCEIYSPCLEDEFDGISVVLATSGGFTGEGAGDYELQDGVMTVRWPFGDPKECSAALTADQISRLLEAAAAVDWDAIEPSYKLPSNPHCCCDQIVSNLKVELATTGGQTVTCRTDWCDEHLPMPGELVAFLTVLRDIGGEVVASCR